MFIDLTLAITPEMIADAQGNEKQVLTGHLGTHFDVMKKKFPLDYVERKAIVFDEHRVKDQLCVDNNVFVIENVCNLKTLLSNGASENI